MLIEFVEEKLGEARYKILEDGNYFAEVPSLRGVWASAKTLEKCRQELKEVLEEWLILKIRDREKIPGFSIKIPKKQSLVYG